jgi:SAM-dependent methyltransferase
MEGFNYTGKCNLDALEYSKHYNRRILDWIRSGLTSAESVLDFGAGKGIYCNELKGYNVYAVEPDVSMHEYIKCPVEARLEDYHKKFDLIYCINVLEHIEDDREILRKFHGALSSGGRLRIFVPAFGVLYSNMDRLVGHYRRYNRNDLLALLADEGYKIEYIRHFDFAGFFVSYLYKLLAGSGEINPRQVIFYDRFIFPLSRILDIVTGGRLVGKNIMLEAVR